MGTYRVIAPLVFSRRTDRPSFRRGVASEELVRCSPGDIVELDDTAAHLLRRKLEPYAEPPKPVRPPRRKTTSFMQDFPRGDEVEVKSEPPEQVPDDD